MSWFKKIFKKNKKMSPEQLQPIRDALSTVPAYQWIKTERVGAVCKFQDVIEEDGILFVEFNDGSRVNHNLLDELMVKLESESAAMDLMGQPVNNVAQATIRNTNIVKDNPIHNLLRKQKPNTVGVDISLDLNMPPKELYHVLESSFDNAQDEIVEFIVADINIESIRTAVKEAIKKFYQ